MSNTATERHILTGLKAGEKTYSFDEKHDKTKPAQMWFCESDEGLIIFIVFYTQACRWSRCLGCNLPSRNSLYYVDYRALVAQIDYIFSQAEIIKQREKIKKVIISNNGSVLDEKTFSSTALMYLMAKINLNFPNVAILTIESRLEYVEPEELKFLSRALKEGDTPTELEFAIGFEAFDEKIRNEVYRKGLSLAKFEKFLKEISEYHYRLKCYFMQKPVPKMTDEEAILDIQQAIDYLSTAAKSHQIKINLHLNPTYVAFGTPLEKSFQEGNYFPPKLVDVAKAALYAENKGISVFVGLADEGQVCPGGSFIRNGEEKIAVKLGEFNRTQNFEILRSVITNRQ